MITTEKKISFPKHSKRGENALERLLKRIRLSEEFPSISQYIIELNQKLAINPDTSNATDLANIILKDHGLTSKLLKMVNSAFYGLAAGKVSTITRAVVVLGYENVRLATLSLAMFEHFKSKSNSKHLKEAVIGSFWSGMMARELAAMDNRVDPEEAFVCAMMIQLGKLVTIYYLPEEYRKITVCMADEGISETKAVKLVCGVTYDDLGMAVAKQWNFPSKICDAMQPLTNDELQNKKSPPERLRALTSFMKTLCESVHGDRLVPDKKGIQTLLDNYQPHISVHRKQLKTLIKDSLENVHQHAQALSLNVSQSNFLDRLESLYDPQRRKLLAAKKAESSDQAVHSFHLKDENQLKAGARIPETRNPKDIIVEGIQELSEIMMTDYDIDTIAVMSLEILYRALDFQRALMFIHDSTSQKMSVRFGYGHNCQQLAGKLDFDLKASKDLFNLSIQVGKDLIVADSFDEKMDHLIPSWYRKHIDAPSFVFLPVVFQKVCIGALYADRDIKGLPVSETEHRYLSMVRNQLILSIKYKQKAA
jgi:HD-like signal output (HDOD) protein